MKLLMSGAPGGVGKPKLRALVLRRFFRPKVGMVDGDTLIEDVAFAFPAALCFRSFLQVAQDAASQVIHLRKAVLQHVSRCLFAADAAGAKHGDSRMPGWIEMLVDPVCEV